MTFNAAEFLATHGGSAEAALAALHRQLEEAQEGRDREGRAAQTARRERDAARSELDTAREAARAAESRAAPEGAVILTGEDATAWQQLQERGGLTAWDQDRTAAQQARETARALAVTRAATHLGIPEDALLEFLGDRAPVVQRRTVDGQEVDVYGLGDGESFRPLAESSVIRALKGSSAPVPTPGLPFPQQRPQPAPATTDAVSEYERRLLGAKRSNT